MSTGQINWKYYLGHLLFWILFFSGWYFLRHQDFSSNTLALKVTIIKVADLAFLVYLSNLVLVPRLLYRKKYFYFFLIYLSLIFISSFLKISIIGSLVVRSGRFSVFDDFRTRLYDNFIPHFLLVSTGVAVKLVIDYVRAQKKLSEIDREKATAELNFLRSQINPHFIFNTLNAIHFQISRENSEAREMVRSFSDLLRYQLYDCNTDKIAIERELAYLKDYVQLQQRRRDENYEVYWQVNGEMKGFEVTPLLLVPLVENAFKHISHHTQRKNQIWISAEKCASEFLFRVENTREPSRPEPGKAEGGIGLKNVKRRLELLYPGKHQLQISDNGNLFRVELKLELENDRGTATGEKID